MAIFGSLLLTSCFFVRAFFSPEAWGVLNFKLILHIVKSQLITYRCQAPHLITSKTTLPWQLRVMSSAVDFVSVSIVSQIHQQFPAGRAAETRCMVTSHIILIKFGHDNHITFRNSLETRLASLRKIYRANGKLMDRIAYFPAVSHAKTVTWEVRLGEESADRT